MHTTQGNIKENVDVKGTFPVKHKLSYIDNPAGACTRIPLVPAHIMFLPWQDASKTKKNRGTWEFLA